MKPVALITGGARGIGRAIVENLAKDHDVVFSYMKTRPDDSIPGTPVSCNLKQDGAPEELIASVLEIHHRLDVIVNNAGAIAETPYELTDRTPHREIFEVNVLAPMALLGAALPYLEDGASVINITSTNARLPALAAPVYSASKAALETWTRGTAKALGPQGIRVNAVAPGAVNTTEKVRPQELTQLFLDNTALGRLAESADIAEAVRFLIGPTAAAITGVVLDVNAGYRL